MGRLLHEYLGLSSLYAKSFPLDGCKKKPSPPLSPPPRSAKRHAPAIELDFLVLHINVLASVGLQENMVARLNNTSSVLPLNDELLPLTMDIPACLDCTPVHIHSSACVCMQVDDVAVTN
eukprot:CAMPEP_0115763114 /NCGR_PEP_ID=MMETSP0272-20121206/101373_1 /TAXON_ID=71861 /ORGANISM="Scrippsiella trochoidea, Strain CCMP3099" /LENGTH=119 /DNA_ID=CAMNT_0003208851 /DNA_START=206 /DNA_END=567 /DNA_ORIENTATION=-